MSSRKFTLPNEKQMPEILIPEYFHGSYVFMIATSSNKIQQTVPIKFLWCTAKISQDLMYDTRQNLALV